MQRERQHEAVVTVEQLVAELERERRRTAALETALREALGDVAADAIVAVVRMYEMREER